MNLEGLNFPPRTWTTIVLVRQQPHKPLHHHKAKCFEHLRFADFSQPIVTSSEVVNLLVAWPDKPDGMLYLQRGAALSKKVILVDKLITYD